MSAVSNPLGTFSLHHDIKISLTNLLKSHQLVTWLICGCITNLCVSFIGEDSVLVSDNFLQTIESNVPASGGKMEQDDSDTDENSRPRDQPRPRPKPKHLDATAVKPQGTEGNCQESNVHTSLDTSSASHITPQLENTAR
jgi:hypothetical protein